MSRIRTRLPGIQKRTLYRCPKLVLRVPCLITIGLVALGGIGYLIYIGAYHLIITDEASITVESDAATFQTHEKFLSVALDTSFMSCLFHKLSERDWKELEELSSLLSPAFLRLGGTEADQVFFNLTENRSSFLKNDDCLNVSSHKKVIITAEDWIKFNKFCLKSKLDVLFDLNVLTRSGSEWNSSNAEALIGFSQKKGFPLNFQLGNEPNSFPHVFNITLTGKQLAQDFDSLRHILNSTKAYKNAILVGPDVTRPKLLETSSLKFLENFLSNTKSVDAASWHQYYLNGRIATLEDFLNPDILDELPKQIEQVNKVVKKISPNLPIWLSETSSAYGGGAYKLSDRFVASFLWLDKLGIAAKFNISVVVRQTLFKDNYALISSYFLPSPDFWVSFFYKNLVGQKVLNLTYDGRKHVSNKYLRFYAHCLSPKSPINGNVVVFGMNLSNKTEIIDSIKGIDFYYPIYSFTFRPENNDLHSRYVLLNEKLLNYNYQDVYKNLKDAEEVRLPLVVPFYSIVFWLFKEARNSTCSHNH